MALDTDFNDMKNTFVSFQFFNYKRFKCVNTFWDTPYILLSKTKHKSYRLCINVRRQIDFHEDPIK